ncbi:MAG: VOC family protein [Solirubrobacterales bacterium]|nr:VOC family protein [Solirubrobacterales bacterium]
MGYLGLNHVALVVTDLERSRHFMGEVLGLERHPRMPRWYCVGDCAVHLLQPMPDAGVDSSLYHRYQHVAIQVDDVCAVLCRLLANGLEPFQIDSALRRRPISSIDDPLDYGTGSVLVRDPDENLFEFMEIGRGLFAGEPDPFAREASTSTRPCAAPGLAR